MKAIIINAKLFLILNFNLLVISSFAQEFEQTISFADTLFAQHNYFDAKKTYQRALFFSNGRRLSHLYKKLGDCESQQGNYLKASKYFDLAYFSSPDDSLQRVFLIDKAKSYIFSANYHHAIVELLNLSDTLGDYWKEQKNFYLGICYFGMDKYEMSKKHFALSINEKFDEERILINRIFEDKKKMQKPNPRMAKFMSMILPGSGQAIIGDTKNAANSFLLTSTILVIGLNVTSAYSLFDALVSIFPWFFRYYQGGYKNAKVLAEKKLKQNRIDAYKEVLEIVSSTKKTYNNEQ